MHVRSWRNIRIYSVLQTQTSTFIIKWWKKKENMFWNNHVKGLDQEDKWSKIPSHGCVSLAAAILITESGATKRFN